MVKTNNIQYSMLDNPMKKKVTIHRFDQYCLPLNMLTLWSFIDHSMTVVYMSVISDIQCYI